MRRVLRLTPMLGVAVVGRATGAQGAPDNPVPRELAEAILRQASGSASARTELTVGRLPAAFTMPLELREATVIGGFTLHGQATALIATGLMPEAAVTDVTDRLRAAGWRAAPLPPAGKGFQEAASASPRVFCSASATLTVRAVAGAATGTNLVVTQSPVVTQACDPSASRPEPMSPAEMPTLVNPPGTGPMSSCFASSRTVQVVGMGSYGTGTTVRTSLSADSLLAHYARQLETSGWRPVPQTSATGQWSRADSTGRARVVTLTVQPSPQAQGCYSVSMNVNTPPGR